MIITVLAATLAATQPQTASVDHSKMDHSKMDHGAAKPTADKAMAKMDCCKDGCACCAKDKAKPTA